MDPPMRHYQIAGSPLEPNLPSGCRKTVMASERDRGYGENGVGLGYLQPSPSAEHRTPKVRGPPGACPGAVHRLNGGGWLAGTQRVLLKI